MDGKNTTNANSYKKIFFLTDDDILNVQNASKQIVNKEQAVFSEFYAWAEMSDDFNDALTDYVLDQLEQFEKDLWSDLVHASVNDEFVASFTSFAEMMHLNEVPFEATLACLVALHEIIENVYRKQEIGDFELIRSFKKVAGISICVIVDTYNNIKNQTIVEQNNALMEMSIPVTNLWKGILFLPLVGIMDSKRAQDVMTAMLTKIAETQSKVLVLDISGIAVVDTAVANYLIKITKATQLMGCVSILSGVSGNIAQTIVELGIDTGEIMTTGSMQNALEQAFARIGVQVDNI